MQAVRTPISMPTTFLAGVLALYIAVQPVVASACPCCLLKALSSGAAKPCCQKVKSLRAHVKAKTASATLPSCCEKRLAGLAKEAAGSSRFCSAGGSTSVTSDCLCMTTSSHVIAVTDRSHKVTHEAGELSTPWWSAASLVIGKHLPHSSSDIRGAIPPPTGLQRCIRLERLLI